VITKVRRGIAAAVVVAAVLGGAASTASAAWCKGGVTVAAARASVGKTIRVKGRVASAYFARTSSGAPTFIDLQYAYPDPRRVTLVIWQENRLNFPAPPERMFRRGTVVCAQGRVARYKGAAEIEVSLWDPASRLVTF
jgi:hypothetical protein